MYQEHTLIAAGFEVVSVDLAGYGESRGLGGPLTLERHGADLADLLEELDITATVVGFAFGAAVLMSLPDYGRITGIVAIGVPSAAGAPYPKMRSAMLRDWPVFAERSAGAICGRDHSPAALRWLGGIFAATPLNSALAGVDVLSQFEPLELEQCWTVPSLFLHGADDTIVSPDVSRAAAEKFTGATLDVIEDSGHFIPWDQPAVLSARIMEFAGTR